VTCWVRYTVLQKTMECGPYTDVWEANRHLHDVAGYDGVTNAYVEIHDDPPGPYQIRQLPNTPIEYGAR
jgi:hypothetical protein